MTGGGGGGAGGGGAGGKLTAGGGSFGIPGGGIVGAVGTWSSGSAQAESSKIRNSHAISWGESGALPHFDGKGPLLPPLATCKPVCTNRPHCSAGVAAFSTGMAMWK